MNHCSCRGCANLFRHHQNAHRLGLLKTMRILVVPEKACSTTTTTMAMLSTTTLAYILMPCIHDKTFPAEPYLEGIVPETHVCCSVALWHKHVS